MNIVNYLYILYKIYNLVVLPGTKRYNFSMKDGLLYSLSPSSSVSFLLKEQAEDDVEVGAKVCLLFDSSWLGRVLYA